MGEIAGFAGDFCAAPKTVTRANERQVAKLYCIISSYLFADFLAGLCPKFVAQGRKTQILFGNDKGKQRLTMVKK